MFQQYRLPIVSIIYLACCLLLFPAYRFIFDEDGMGYMMVARRLAEGDYQNAINGYWSPLHSWIALPFIKAGMTEITAFKLTSWLTGWLILIWVHRLSSKTGLDNRYKTWLLLTCIPVIIYYSTFELAADVLFCWLVLVYVDIITEENFFEKPWLNLACGVAGAFLYYSKAYAFPFFLLHFVVLQIWFYLNSSGPERRKWLIRNLALGIGVLFLLSAPWIWLLYDKYHEFTIGYSGRLNQNVHLYSRQPTTNALVYPPPYPDSPGYWEDPWFFPVKRTPGEYYFRPDILVKQVRLFLTNLLRGVTAFTYLSFLNLAILFGTGIYLLQQRNRVIFIFFLTAVLLPSGYLLVFIEPRYIWPVNLLLMISGAFLLQVVLSRLQIQRRAALLCWIFFFGSFLINQINQLKDDAGSNEELFKLAAFAEEKNIRGRYLHADNADYNIIHKLAFLTRSSTWSLLKRDAPYEEHLVAMRSEKLNYYFFRYNNARELDMFMKSALYKAAHKVHDTGGDNLLILEIK